MNHVSKRISSAGKRRGIVAILVAVSLIVLIGAAALALDAGRLFDGRWQAQSTAEAAAMAAAIDLYNGAASQAEASARSMAAANGFANDGKSSTVTVNIPPKSGAFSQVAGYVEVIVEFRQNRGFSNVFGGPPGSVIGRAVAGGTTTYVPGSILVLDPKKKKALSLNKNGSQLVVEGAIAVNSKAKNALKIGKGSRIKANDVMVSGGIDKGSRRRIDGTIHARAPQTDDPLAGLSPPEPGPIRKLSDYKSGKSYVLEPGTYREKLEFSKDDIVTMKPGIYHLSEGGMRFKDESSLVASGVMIYGASGKKIEFATRGDVVLSPPTSGPYTGISIFQNPDKNGGVGFKNGRDYDVKGTIYVPNGRVKFKNTEFELGGDEADEESDEDDSDDGDSQEPDGEEPVQTFDQLSGIGAQLIARTLSIDKRSSVHIRGTGLNLVRPLLSIVE